VPPEDLAEVEAVDRKGDGERKEPRLPDQDQKKSFQYWYRSLPMMPSRTTDRTMARTYMNRKRVCVFRGGWYSCRNVLTRA